MKWILIFGNVLSENSYSSEDEPDYIYKRIFNMDEIKEMHRDRKRARNDLEYIETRLSKQPDF